MNDELKASMNSEMEAALTRYREALQGYANALRERSSRRIAIPRFAPLKPAANHFGASPSTLRRRADEGKIRLVKHGARTLVDMDSAQEYFDNLPEVRPVYRRPSKDRCPWPRDEATESPGVKSHG
jgi:hypothetical protein